MLLQKQNLPVLISHFCCLYFTSNNSHMGSTEEPIGRAYWEPNSNNNTERVCGGIYSYCSWRRRYQNLI